MSNAISNIYAERSFVLLAELVREFPELRHARHHLDAIDVTAGQGIVELELRSLPATGYGCTIVERRVRVTEHVKRFGGREHTVAWILYGPEVAAALYLSDGGPTPALLSFTNPVYFLLASLTAPRYLAPTMNAPIEITAETFTTLTPGKLLARANGRVSMALGDMAVAVAAFEILN